MPNGMQGSKIRKDSVVKTCKRCGRMFQFYGFGYGYCETCAVIDNEIFHKVKEYIWEHGTASGNDVSEALGVSLKQIFTYLREGRLEIPDTSPIFIRCESCNQQIRYGRYCQECGTRLRKDLTSATRAELYEIGEAPSTKSGKMHFLK